MRKQIALPILLFLIGSVASAAPNFVSGPDGEMVSDVELDLNVLPAFTWVADPFLKTPVGRSPASAVKEATEYKLQATTFEGQEAVAVVNDHVVRVGDRVGRRTVMKIGKDFVLLGDRGSVIEATLEEAKAEAGDKREPASSKSEAAPPTGQIKIEELKK